MSWIYILKSEEDGKLYVGSTKNATRRIKDHNNGKVRSTKGRRPLVLIYEEQLTSTTEARRRELFLKSGQGRKWIKENVLARRSG